MFRDTQSAATSVMALVTSVGSRQRHTLQAVRREACFSLTHCVLPPHSHRCQFPPPRAVGLQRCLLHTFRVHQSCKNCNCSREARRLLKISLSSREDFHNPSNIFRQPGRGLGFSPTADSQDALQEKGWEGRRGGHPGIPLGTYKESSM